MVLRICFAVTSRLINTQANVWRSKLLDNSRCEKFPLLTIPSLMRHTDTIFSSYCSTNNLSNICGDNSQSKDKKKPICGKKKSGGEKKKASNCQKKKQSPCSSSSKKTGGGDKKSCCGNKKQSKCGSKKASKCEKKKDPCVKKKKDPCADLKKKSDDGAASCSKCGDKPCQCGQNIWPSFCGKGKSKSPEKAPVQTMEAVVFDGKKKTVSFRKDYPRPKIAAPDDVVVKVEYAGVCGTDLHIISGKFPSAEDKEYALGHEFSARVHKIGPAVTSLKEGQAVTIDPQVPCKVCKFCQMGNYHLCHKEGINNYIGIHYNGGWAQYAKVKDFQCQVLPEDMDTSVAALCEPYADIAHALDRAQPLIVGTKILLLGAGIAGAIFTTLLHHFGHRDVTVTDPNENRLKGLEKLDTGYRLIHPECLDVEKELYDVIFDATGYPAAFEQGYKYLDNGGKYIMYGRCPWDSKATINPFELFDKEISILGAKTNVFTVIKSIWYIYTMTPRYVTFDKLGIKTFALCDYEKALEAMKSAKVTKAMFKMV